MLQKIYGHLWQLQQQTQCDFGWFNNILELGRTVRAAVASKKRVFYPSRRELKAFRNFLNSKQNKLQVNKATFLAFHCEFILLFTSADAIYHYFIYFSRVRRCTDRHFLKYRKQRKYFINPDGPKYHDYLLPMNWLNISYYSFAWKPDCFLVSILMCHRFLYKE